MSKKILVVEDDPTMSSLICLMLRKKGYQVAAAFDGIEGLQSVREENPDVVVLDVMMPGIDGFEVCRCLRANPDTAQLPVLMLTARTGPRDQRTGFAVGADDYLGKPVELAELLTRIESLLFFSRVT